MDVNANLITKIGKIGHQNWLLEDVRQMTFFIGPNNSGKSRKLREMYADVQSKWFYDISKASVNKVSETLLTYLNKVNESHKLTNHFRTIIQPENLRHTLESLMYQPGSIEMLLNKLFEGSLSRSSYNTAHHRQDFIRTMIEWIENQFDIFYDNFDYNKNLQFSRVYIPTLRSLRQVAQDDIFESRTLKDYFLSSSNGEVIFTGHSLYDDLKAHLLGSHDKRKKVREFEKYLSENFFFGNEIALVPMVDKDVVYVKEGDDLDRPIYDLGDGIQSIIILTFRVFMAEEPTMFFIEEPEHYLHAGLQRTLIETLAKHKEHMFFMTTHSNHFLDLAQERDDISIQQVSRVKGESKVQASLDYGELLNELGVRASSVLLANCSIWVEGVTDKLYLRAYLNKYIEELEDEDKKSKLKSYHENLHFVFTEYQGSNITHWDFSDGLESDGSETPAKRLNRNILLIADADIECKGERVESLREALGEAFYLLEYKEIENFIPFDILIDTAKARWGTFTQRADCDIDKFNNIKESSFRKKDVGIGKVLERNVVKAEGLKRNFYSDKSGTIKDKVKFCHTAISLMNESDDWKLTPELTLLCKRVWDFIESHNQ